MLKITKSGLKVIDTPYAINEPFVGVLNVTDKYHGKIEVVVNRYDKNDLEYKYPLSVEYIYKNGGNFQIFDYDRVKDGVDVLSFGHAKMKEFLLTLKTPAVRDDDGEIVNPGVPVFTDAEIEIIDL